MMDLLTKIYKKKLKKNEEKKKEQHSLSFCLQIFWVWNFRDLWPPMGPPQNCFLTWTTTI